MSRQKDHEKLTRRSMIGYGSGDFAVELVINCVIFYLLYYYTDVLLIPSTIAGTIILTSRMIQAMMNPVVGILSDRTETRWGKKRPFLFFGALPLGLFFFLVFWPAGIITEEKELFAFVSSMLFLIAFSFVAIPYASLASVITHDSHERSVVSAWRMAFALLGSLVAAGATRPLASLFENEAAGFRATALIYAVSVFLILIFTFLSTRERTIAEPAKDTGACFRDFLLIRHNSPFLILAFSSLLFFMALNTLAATVNYYFKYVLDAEKMIAVAFVSLFAAAGCAIPLFVKLANKWGKKKSFLGSTLFFFFILMVNYAAGIQDVPFTIAVLILAGIGISGIFLFPWSLVPDTVEYMQWKTGLRREGMLYGFFILFFNSSAALAGLINGAGLDLEGYVPNAVQAETTRQGIFLLMTVVPAVSILAGSLLLSFYPIDEAMHKKIIDDIQSRDEG